MLTHNIEHLSIVILGSWNTRIFSPLWLKNIGLIESEKILIEAAVNSPGNALRFDLGDILLHVSDNDLTMRIKEDKEELLSEIENKTINILDKLKHTPVIAAGINFQYIDKEPSAENLKLFNLHDNSTISDNDYNIESTSIRRKITYNDQVLNLTVELNTEGEITYNFNFHKDLSTTAEAKKYINGNTDTLKSKSVQIINDFYGYDWPQEDSNDK